MGQFSKNYLYVYEFGSMQSFEYLLVINAWSPKISRNPIIIQIMYYNISKNKGTPWPKKKNSILSSHNGILSFSISLPQHEHILLWSIFLPHEVAFYNFIDRENIYIMILGFINIVGFHILLIYFLKPIIICFFYKRCKKHNKL